MNRLDNLRHLESKLKSMHLELNLLNKKIETGLDQKKDVYNFCLKRNDLNTNIYFCSRKIENLQDKKGMLGDALIEPIGIKIP